MNLRLLRKKLISLIVLASAIQLAGCVSSKPMVFTAVAVKELGIKYQLLKKDVKGEDCSGQYGSYELATKNAIANTKGANALVNARFSRREVPIAKICVTVTGDAVKI